MKTKQDEAKLLKTIKNLRDEIKSLKSDLKQKELEVKAFDCLVDIISIHYKTNVKHKFRTKAIAQLRETCKYSIETLCNCFGCKRDAYYKYRRKYILSQAFEDESDD